MDVFNEAFPIAKVTLGLLEKVIVSEKLKINLKEGLYLIVW
jgi:hypothetical protein